MNLLKYSIIIATSSQLVFNHDFLIFHFSLDWNSQTSIRECWLVGLPDMNQKRQNVRDAQVNLMNHLIDLGVAGKNEFWFLSVASHFYCIQCHSELFIKIISL